MRVRLNRAVVALSAGLSLVTTIESVGARYPHFPAHSVTVTASICRRGIDTFPGDGVFDAMFDEPVCSLFAPPASVTMYSEERPAMEFPIAPPRGVSAVPPGTQLFSATLILTPLIGDNLGLAADDVVELWAYVGNGSVGLNDLHPGGKIPAGHLTGPTPDGAIAVPLDAVALSPLVSSPKVRWIGVMLKAVRGRSSVGATVVGADGGSPPADRPKLRLRW